MAHEPIPFKGEGDRWNECPAYNVCLDIAAKRMWRDWNCAGCAMDPIVKGGQMQNLTGMKVCNRCDKEKALGKFRPDKRSADGHSGVCYECWGKPEGDELEPFVAKPKAVNGKLVLDVQLEIDLDTVAQAVAGKINYEEIAVIAFKKLAEKMST